MTEQKRTGTGIEGGRSSARLISVPSTGASRTGGLGSQGPHKPQSGGQNPGPPPTPLATAGVILVWKGHRLRARSWHAFMVAQVREGRPVTVAHERTACGIDLQDHIVTPIEIDGEVTCRGCAGYMREARRVLPDRLSEGVAA